MYVHMWLRYCAIPLFTVPASTDTYTLSLHDALPISVLNLDGAWIDIVKRKLATPPEFIQSIFQNFPKAEDFQQIVPDRKSTRLNSSHPSISYAVFCLTRKTSTH